MDKKKPEKKEEHEEELKETLQRLQADFENYKKWVESKKEDDFKRGKVELVRSLLPVLDQIELALQNKEKEAFVKGVEMIFAEFQSVLQKEGLQHIGCIGKKFDPYLHEVLLHEKCDTDEDIIVGELQKGYKIGEAIIRHSKVKVCKK
ncbi:MAG TPA: nucleotide exchange factor GrpE [Candidatus Nanoarchaeia archaeon]|nr:nucleotide exchange factor GrpE [Candidatus Nanoarchaeia archaeon]